MKSLIFLAIAVAVPLIAIRILKSRLGSDKEGAWPFHARKPLSAPEQILYFRLVKALPEHMVLAQVGLSRILGVNKGNNYQAWHNRINRMSADFVICQKDSSVVAVIELDDSTHERADRKVADTKKNRALEAAGIPIHRWQAKALPDEASIRQALRPIQSAIRAVA